MPLNKTNKFEDDIKYIYQMLCAKHHFSFSKYADGEYAVLRNKRFTNCDLWTFSPTVHKSEYKYLMDSYQYEHKDYYVGISCPCCQPQGHIQWMRDNVRTDNVTWANIFVNSNYQFFLDNFLTIFDKWQGKVHLVAHQDGQGKKLPFKVDEYHSIKIGSWLNPHLENILQKLRKVASEADDQLFLFSGGPLGNILAHQLHVTNSKNTYIDIGSTINPWTVGKNRKYLKAGNTLTKTCIW